MAQAGGIMLLSDYSAEEREEKLMVFTGIEGARFRKPVVPGDQMRIEVTVLNRRPTMAKLKGVATVDGALVSDATFTAAMVARKRPSKDGGNA
jgi:3-hydroxyacyl-[acyl-carrier-protein] dehydratase